MDNSWRIVKIKKNNIYCKLHYYEQYPVYMSHKFYVLYTIYCNFLFNKQ